MHENRETSETPVVQPGRRSAGEGQSHKARVYVSEESHSGILPITTVRLNVEENQLVNVFGEFGICLGGLKSA